MTETFGAELLPDQRKAVARDATPEALIAAMSPQQRSAARSRLMELERARSSADELAEIALGYRLLGEPEDSLRLAARLKSLEPDRARGFSLAAASYVELKDWDAAVHEAAIAKERDPSDTMAASIYQLYRHKLADRDLPIPRGRAADDGGFVKADPAMKDRVTTAAQAAMRNLDVPLIPIPQALETPDAGSSSTAGLAVTSALTAAGGLLLCFGLGKPLEERYPNIRRNIAIGALVAAPTVAVIAEAPAVVQAVGAALETTFTSAGAPPLQFATLGPSIGGSSAVGAARLAIGGLAAGGVTLGLKRAAEQYSFAKTDSDPPATARAPGPHSSVKKPSATNSELQRLIDSLFKASDTQPGGTAGAARREFSTGMPTKGKFHRIPAGERLQWLRKIMREQRLDPVDRATAEAIRDDLQQAVNLYQRKGTP